MGGMGKFSASGGDSPHPRRENSPYSANVDVALQIWQFSIQFFFTICSNYVENNKLLKVKRNFSVVHCCSTHARMICLE